MKNKLNENDVNYIKVYCECGHSLGFLRNHSAVCDWCGKRVYPSKECEFREKLEKKLKVKEKRYEYSDIKRNTN